MSSPANPNQQSGDPGYGQQPPQQAPPSYPIQQQSYAAPQYGAPQYGAPQYGVPAQQRTNSMAIVAFILSFFVSIVAVILGHIAMGQIKRTGEGGHGLAVAALIIGYIGIAGWVFFWLLVILIMMGVMGSVAFLAPFVEMIDSMR